MEDADGWHRAGRVLNVRRHAELRRFAQAAATHVPCGPLLRLPIPLIEQGLMAMFELSGIGHTLTRGR